MEYESQGHRHRLFQTTSQIVESIHSEDHRVAARISSLSESMQVGS